MPSDDRLDDLFEDLEQQAAGLELADRDAELADRVRGEYSTVTLAARVHASRGCPVALVLRSGQVVEGRLLDAGRDWCALAAPGGTTWLVRLAAVARARGMSSRAVPEAARPVTARLGFAAALHRFAEGATGLRFQLEAGTPLHARLVRVGADFVELAPVTGAASSIELVALAAVQAVRVG